MWLTGAVPFCLSGNDAPASSFRQITSDASGAFRIADVPASVLPPGDYDLRIKESQLLVRVVRNVIVPSPGDAKQIVLITGPGALMAITLWTLPTSKV